MKYIVYKDNCTELGRKTLKIFGEKLKMSE